MQIQLLLNQTQTLLLAALGLILGPCIPKVIKYMTTISGQKQISLEKSFYAHCHPQGLDLRELSVIINSAQATQDPLWKPFKLLIFDKEKEQTKVWCLLFSTTAELHLDWLPCFQISFFIMIFLSPYSSRLILLP